MEHIVKLLAFRSLADQLVLHLSESIQELFLALINIVLDTLKYCRLVTMFIDGLRATVFLLFEEFFAATYVIKLLVGLAGVQGFHSPCLLGLFRGESTFLQVLFLVL